MIMEELYDEELTGLLSEGLNWMARCSLCPPSHEPERTYDPAQAIIAAALHALAREDIEAFSSIHHVVNLSYFQYPHMKSWLKDDHQFSKQDIVKCFTTLAWLLVEEILSPQSPLVAAVTGLEEKYKLCGIFVQAVVCCAKRTAKAAQSNEKKAPEMKTASTQTCFEEIETVPELGATKKDDSATPVEPAVHLDKTEILVQGRAGKQKTFSLKTLLLSAVERGPKTVDAVLKICGDVKNDDKSISELIYLAVKSKRTKVLETLLWHGLDVQFSDEEGNAPLHIAAASNYSRIVKKLTFAGASVTKANRSGQLPLHLTSDPEIIEHLIEKGADVNAKTPAGETALHHAVSNGNKEAVETLMKFGANPNAIDASGLTPLLVALQSRNQEMIELLTRRGAVVVENFCHTDQSFHKGRLETVEEVSEEEETDDADINNNNEAESDLPEIGAFQDLMTPQELSVDLNKDGPIHKAAAEGRLEAVTELLDGGVDVDTKGCSGYTALQYAAKYGHLSIVQSLLQRGADINLGNDWNWTPLHHAAHYSRCDIAEFLIQAGADTQLVDCVYGKTPLSWATCNFKLIKLFKSKGIYN